MVMLMLLRRMALMPPGTMVARTSLANLPVAVLRALGAACTQRLKCVLREAVLAARRRGGVGAGVDDELDSLVLVLTAVIQSWTSHDGHSPFARVYRTQATPVRDFATYPHALTPSHQVAADRANQYRPSAHHPAPLYRR